jgi:methyl-accepting chemotaxis protein
VVADEVRKLAERTAKSTHQIASTVESIQTGTASAVSSMHDGVARVGGGVEMANRAGESMERIQEGAATVVSTISGISLALKEQGVASTEIARNVERIAQMADQNNTAVGQTARTAQQLEHLAANLQAAVAHFRFG